MSNPKTMTWQQVKDQLDQLTPAQLDQRAIVFDFEANVFTSISHAFTASSNDAGESVWGSPPSEVIAEQLVLQVW